MLYKCSKNNSLKSFWDKLNAAIYYKESYELMSYENRVYVKTHILIANSLKNYPTYYF